jgi:hypothetical protein
VGSRALEALGDPTRRAIFERLVEGPAQTRIELEHRGFDRHGTDADAVRGSIDSPQGWDYCLDVFAKYVAA